MLIGSLFDVNYAISINLTFNHIPTFLFQPYFCGHWNFCRQFGSQSGLQRAKENIEKFFPIVGITGQMQQSILLAEKLIPEFFGGASKLNLNIKKNSGKSDYKHIQKSNLSTKAQDKLRRELEFEYDLYRYLVQRLSWQIDKYL